MPPAVIFHTADFHNRLKPGAARRLAALKHGHPGALLLDAGDAVGAGNLTYRPRGEPILRQMAGIGYAAMAMGNRESHPNREILNRKLRDAAFPVLAANLVAKRRGPSPKVRDHILIDGSPRIAVIGLAPQITRPDSLWAAVTDFVFDDPVVVAARCAHALRKKADLVVLLSHCGIRVDRMLAAIEDVDLVLGGHSHRELIEQEPGRATVVHPGRYGSHVSRTDIRRRDDARSELIPLEAEP